MIMRLCLPALALAFLATTVSAAEPVYDIDMYALMSGKCSRLKIAGSEFGCKAVAYFHSEQGRADFTVVLEDQPGKSHVVSFSGENARRDQDDRYELAIDRMLIKSSEGRKVDGLPVPSVEMSSGTCRQIGSFATRQISSISCEATAANGKTYEMQFESDGSPMMVRRLRQSALPSEARRANQIAQVECRLKAEVAKVLPRDRTDYIIRCLAEDGHKPGGADDQ